MRVAISSCWNYRDTWKPFGMLLRKFWPDCPYTKWLITDTVEVDSIPMRMCIAGQDKNWSQCLASFARMSDEPILLFLDDFFPSGPFSQSLIKEALEEFQRLKAGCLRLYPCPGSDEDIGHDHIGKVSLNASYRISTMPAIWKPSLLLQILEKCDNPWDFETYGSQYSKKVQEEIYSWKRESRPWPVDIMATGITRGAWNQGAIELFERHGIEVDLTLRPMRVQVC